MGVWLFMDSYIKFAIPTLDHIPFLKKLNLHSMPVLSGIVSDNMEGGKDKKTGKNKVILVGPWGGNGGYSWDDRCYDGVREITLVYARCIDSIQLVYDRNGKPFSAEKHGGVGGDQTAEIKLHYPEEFLTHVSGHYCPVMYGGKPVIRSLTFKTNQRTFGPFGVEEGTPFSFTLNGGRIVGLKGRSGWYLDSISFHVSRPKKGLLERLQLILKMLTFQKLRKAPPIPASNPHQTPLITA